MNTFSFQWGEEEEEKEEREEAGHRLCQGQPEGAACRPDQLLRTDKGAVWNMVACFYHKSISFTNILF